MPIKVISISTDTVIELKSISEGNFFSKYEGSYDFTPTAHEQIAPTKNKVLKDNILVKATPYAEVSNLSGGYTATIL